MRQKQHLSMGQEGCYLLSLIEAGERWLLRNRGVKTSFDDLLMYRLFLEAGWIEKDCFILEPAQIFESLVGGRWTWSKEGADYVPQDDEVVVDRWEWKRTMSTSAHFRLSDWDPMGEDGSETVRNGVVVSKRVLRRVG